jgi:hypothetical protein
MGGVPGIAPGGAPTDDVAAQADEAMASKTKDKHIFTISFLPMHAKRSSLHAKKPRREE